jgi:hypothetical protein
VFEIRLRSPDVGEGYFLGIAEGFPEVLVYGRSVRETEADLTRALIAHLEKLRDLEATRLELYDFPTVRVVRLRVGRDAQ